MGRAVPLPLMTGAQSTTRTPIVAGTRSRRCTALIVAAAIAGMLGLALWMQPSAEGVGTHRQLGLPRCGWIVAADMPCPTCGMTTAWSHAVRGDLPAAFMAQPFGLLTALGAIGALLVAMGMAVSGRPLRERWTRLVTARMFLGLAALAAAAWVFKIIVHRGIAW